MNSSRFQLVHNLPPDSKRCSQPPHWSSKFGRGPQHFPHKSTSARFFYFFYLLFFIFSFFYFLNLIFWMCRGEKDSCRDERPSRFQSLARPCSIFALWLLPLALPLASFGVYTVDYHLHRKCEKWTLLTRRSATFHGLICPVEVFHHLYMAG